MRRWRAAALALALPALAIAQPYDPRFTWRTLETGHFRVHYHQGLSALARRVAAAAERAHVLLVPAFANAPARRTEVVLSDDADDANGSATPLPYDTIRLYAVPPAPFSELNDEGDWVEALVTHEYVHVLHLDTIRGFPAAFDAVFGKVLAPAALGPSLLTEGFAVLHEADAEGGADGGRNASALFDMYARAMVTEGPFPRLDVAVNQPLLWPRGDMAYLLGGRFLAYLRERCGREALTAFTLDQGAQVWPYRFDTLARRHLGEDLATLWDDFGRTLTAAAEAELARIRERPVTPATRLTARGSSVLHPRWLPDGSALVYFDQGTEERPGLRRVRLDGRDEGRVADVEANGTFALARDGAAVVAETDVWREFRVYDDLYRLDLATGARRRLTDGERASDPELTPDGESVVYAVHLGGGEAALRRRALAGGAPETLFQRDGVQVSGPRVSPDGRRIAFEHAERGRRRVAVLEDGEVSLVTDADAIALAPSWSPDGRTLFYTSERTGVYNLYALELEEHRLWQVTNLELGAFEPQPSPDGTRLAFVGYGRSGFDLFTTPLDRSAWTEPAPPRGRRTGEAAPPAAPPEVPDRPYRALDTVLPTFWLPLLGSDGSGTTVGALTGGADVLLHHVYLAQAWYGLESREPGYSASYVGTWLYPRLQLASSRHVDSAPGRLDLNEELWTPLQASVTFTDTHLVRETALTVGWRALRLRGLGGTPLVDAAGVAPYRDGTASEWSATLTFSDARRFVSSISPEEGRVVSLGLRGAHEALGGSFTYGRARASISQYLRVPWTSHVVLALYGSVGLARGTLGGRQPFKLGGPQAGDLAATALAPLLGPVAPGDVLRGYPSEVFQGSALENGSVELRFPIAVLERGYRAWPLQLRRLHGALFMDAGQVVPAPPSGGAELGALRELSFGAGGELRAELVLGYYLRTDLRLGLARGLGRMLASAERRAELGADHAATQVYLVLGPSF